jgi:hypothetical protein
MKHDVLWIFQNPKAVVFGIHPGFQGFRHRMDSMMGFSTDLITG